MGWDDDMLRDTVLSMPEFSGLPQLGKDAVGEKIDGFLASQAQETKQIDRTCSRIYPGGTWRNDSNEQDCDHSWCSAAAAVHLPFPLTTRMISNQTVAYGVSFS